MQFLPIASIIVAENRQRKEFDQAKLIELGDSVQNPSLGLLHPIVTRRADGATILVAGERRLRVFRDSAELGVQCFHAGQPVPAGTIPAIDIGELDPLSAWEAELEENIRRVDLTWQERARATASLMELRQKQAVVAGKPAPTYADIALEVRDGKEGAQQGDTRAEILVSRHLHDPDVAAATDVRQALKVLKRKEERTRNTALAESLGKTMTGAAHTLVNTTAEEWLTSCPSEKFDVILTDPPYGMGADTFGDSGGMILDGAHGYEDTPETFQRILYWLPEETFRIAKSGAHIYLFCDLEWFSEIKSRMEEAGWRVFRTPIIWHKPSGFRAPWPEHGPQRRYETALYAIKGDRRTQKLAGDVITCPPDENLGHAAQKPVELYRELLSRSIIPGDEVLDLFCGTGPIFPAAHALKCRATGVELDPASYAIAAKRIQDLK